LHTTQPMRSFTKVLLVSFLIPLLLSCTAYRSVTRNQPITGELLSSLKTGKRYAFKLKLGETQFIKVTSVVDERVTGYLLVKDEHGKTIETNYSDRFENIENNVASISVSEVQWGITSIGLSFLLMIIIGIMGWS